MKTKLQSHIVIEQRERERERERGDINRPWLSGCPSTCCRSPERRPTGKRSPCSRAPCSTFPQSQTPEHGGNRQKKRMGEREGGGGKVRHIKRSILNGVPVCLEGSLGCAVGAFGEAQVARRGSRRPQITPEG